MDGGSENYPSSLPIGIFGVRMVGVQEGSEKCQFSVSGRVPCAYGSQFLRTVRQDHGRERTVNLRCEVRPNLCLHCNFHAQLHSIAVVW